MKKINIYLHPEIISLVKLAIENEVNKTEFKKFMLEKQRKPKER